jgi:hypothetical protein
VKFLTNKNLARLDNLLFTIKKAAQGFHSGVHLTTKKGHGLEFAESRQYVPGDNPKHIDWGLFARTEKLYVRTYQEERNHRIFIIIDGSKSLLLFKEWYNAFSLALAIGYISLINKEVVSLTLTSFTKEYRGILQGRGSISSFGYLLALEEALFSAPKKLTKFLLPETAPSTFAQLAASNLNNRGGICYFITDLMYSSAKLKEILSPLNRGNWVCKVVHIDNTTVNESVINYGEVRDSEDSSTTTFSFELSKYQELISSHFKEMRQTLNRLGREYHYWNPKIETVPFLETSHLLLS